MAKENKPLSNLGIALLIVSSFISGIIFSTMVLDWEKNRGFPLCVGDLKKDVIYKCISSVFLIQKTEKNPLPPQACQLPENYPEHFIVRKVGENYELIPVNLEKKISLKRE